MARMPRSRSRACRPAPSHEGTRRRAGYVLVPIVLMLAVVGAIAYWLGLDATMSGQSLSREAEAATAESVARAGLDYARWRSAESGCGGSFTLPSKTLGRNAFSATITAGGSTATTSVSADRDSWIDDSMVSTAHGSDALLAVEYKNGKTTQALYRFDLNAIPAGSRINSAIAWLYLDASYPHPEGPVFVHRVKTSWLEGDVTWNGFAASHETASLATIPAQKTGGVWVPVQLTAQVQAWVNGQPNYGVVLRTSADGVATRYGSREGGHPPHLDVTIGNAAVSTATIAATATLASGTQRSRTATAEPTYQPPSHFAGLLEPAFVDDGYISSSQTDLSWGAAATLGVAPGSKRALVRFELEGMIPRGVRVRRASLRLMVKTQSTAGGIGLYGITRPWVEGACTGTGGCSGGATWTKWDGTSVWSSAGGDIEAVSTAVSTVANAGGWTEWDVTDLVQGWASGARENNGVLLSSVAGAADFYSSDDANSSRRPRLEIEYACACGDACLVPQGSGALLLVVGNATTPAAHDQSLRARFQDWGYTVGLIDDGDAASAFTTAASTRDVAYVSGTVSDTTLGTKLTALAIGVVSEDGALNDELGFAAGATTSVAVELGVVDNSHYLTAAFVPGNVRIHDLPMRISSVSGAEAPGLQTLANAGGAGALSVIEKGGLLQSGAAAAARRVKLPFDGAGGIDWDHVNGNGRLLLSRALAWAGNADVASDLGPIAHWRLDDGAGSVAVDSEGGHDGKLIGPLWVAGKVAGALSFDGVDDVVQVPHDPKLNFSGAITLTAWMNTDTLTASYRTIVNKGVSGTQQDYWFGIFNNELRFTFYASGAYRRVGFAPGFAVGTWYHVAASFEDATDRVRLYVGGVEVANGTIAYTPPTGTYDLLIGKSNAASQIWDGLLDDVRIYDRVLAADEIAAVAADTGGGAGKEVVPPGGGGAPPQVSGCSGTYRDEFKSTTYSGSDGSLAWKGDWQEVNEADGAKQGDEVVEVDSDATSTPGSNQLRVQDNDGGGEGVVRELDLAGAGVATLSLRYRRDALDAADEYVAVGISKSGKAGPFSEIGRLAGTADDKTYQTFSRDISVYASETSAIRLLGSSSMGGSDAVWFDDVEVSCTP